MNQIKAILNKAVAALSHVPGVEAVVLGGSRASGTHTPSSDIDIGVYYNDLTLDLDALNKAAQLVDDMHREALITPPGGWGQWVNGGGWLTIDNHAVDFVLRDISRVEKVIDEAQKGIISPHYQTGHPHAFISVMYAGELAISKLLWEKDSKISAMKQIAEQYPEPLQKALIHLFSFEAEFSLYLAEDSARKDDLYYVAAHIVRSVSALNQVLFALNKQYCLNEKKAVKIIDSFSIHPADYKTRIDTVFSTAGTDSIHACAKLRQLLDETKSLLPAEQTAHVATTLDDLSHSKGSHC